MADRRRQFEHFYGFIGREQISFILPLFEAPLRASQVRHQGGLPPHRDGIADKAIAWVRKQKALTADKPFFMFAPGAARPPHQVPQGGPSVTKGEFDDGWDALRGTHDRASEELGVIPADAELTERPEERYRHGQICQRS